MATEDITLQIKLDDVKAALRQVPTLTEKEFNAMEKVASKTLRKVGKEAEKALKDAEKAAEKAQAEIQKAAEEQMQAVGKVGDMFTGGLVGDLEDISKAFGPIGFAAIAAAGGIMTAVTAVGALGTAIVAIQDKAEDTIDRLEELGKADLVTEEQRKNVDIAKAAFESMDLAIGKLAISLADNFSPDIQQVARNITTLTDRIDSFLYSIRDRSLLEELAVSFVVVRDTVADVQFPLEVLAKAFGMLQEATTGSRGAFGDWGYAQIEARKAAAAAATGIDRQRDSLENLTLEGQKAQAGIEGLAIAYDDEEKKTQKSKKAHDERKKALETEQKAQEEYARILKDSTSDQETEEMKILRLHADRSAAARKAIKDAEALAKAQAEMDARLFRDMQKLEDDRAAKAEKAKNERLASAKKENEAYQAFVAKRIEKEMEMQRAADAARVAASQALQEAIEAETEAERQAYEKLYGTILGVLGPVGELGAAMAEISERQLEGIREERKALRDQIAEATGYEKIRLQQRLNALNDEAEGYRKLQMVAFRVRKGIAISEAIVNGAVAATRALAELGPVAGGIAAAVIATTTAAQIALISSERPKFHTGLDPSEMPAVITRGEGVANVRAMNQPGFAETLRAANAGLPAQSSGPVVIALNDRILAQLDARTQRVRGRVAGGNVVRLGTATHYG